ncbi:unnamed protein product [Moneuplotes crassus]|uniref:Uncharacterized protein n=2 Tax=Euplotes crassus TaxID=5936 RepID=A0AAD1UI65_EUPCR|nr:unnamed protein product [Moneuplotes crassus]
MEIKGVRIKATEEDQHKASSGHMVQTVRSSLNLHPSLKLVDKDNENSKINETKLKKPKIRAKKTKKEISLSRRKGVLDSIGLLIGKSVSSTSKKLFSPDKSPRPKIDENLKKLERMLNQQTKKHKLRSELASRESSCSKFLNSPKKSRNFFETKTNKFQKAKKNNKSKLNFPKSDPKLIQTLKEWGKYKARRDQLSLERANAKAIMNYTARQHHKNFKEVAKYNSSYYLRNYFPNNGRIAEDVDSESTFTKPDISKPEVVIKSPTERALSQLPKIRKNGIKAPNMIDFTKNIEEMNANQLNEYGKPHFDVDLDNDKFLSLSPIKSKQSKLRTYYDKNLWKHMNDFRNDGKTKIQRVRRKYRNIVSSELTAKNINAGVDSEDENPEPPIIFARRNKNDQQRYQQLKEINSLKDRLAKDGIVCDTKTLRSAILMPEDIE